MKKRILTINQVAKIRNKLFYKNMTQTDLCNELPSKPHRVKLCNCLRGAIVDENLEKELIEWLKATDNTPISKEA